MEGEREGTERTAQTQAQPPHVPRVENAPAPPEARAVFSMVEKTGLILFRFDRAKGLSYVSESIRAFVGYGAPDFIADPALLVRIIHPAQRDEVAKLIENLRSGPPAPFSRRPRFVTKDGKDAWLEVRGVPEFDGAGRHVGYFGIAIDATHLVESERLAEEGRVRHRMLFEGAPLPMLLYDASTLVIVRANSRACEMYGLPREELEGSFISERVNPEEWPLTLETIRRDEPDSAVTVTHRTLHRKADGTLFPVQVAGVNIQLEGRTLRHVILRDLTELEAAEETIRNLRRSIESAGAGVLVLDPFWRVIDANPAASAISGQPASEILGKDLLELTGGQSAIVLEQAKRIASSGQTWTGEILCERKGEAPVRTGLTITPVLDSRGEVARFVAMCRDPASPGPAVEAFSETSVDALLLADFMSHDLKNYLAAVLGYLDLLKASPKVSDDLRPLIQVARTQAENSLQLVNETRRLLPRGRAEGKESVPADLARIIEEAIARVEPIARGRELKIRKRYLVKEAPVEQPWVFREVLVNLLHNAIKYDPHPEILIDVTLEEALVNSHSRLRVRVSDRGVGIPQDAREHLFEPGRPRGNGPAPATDVMAPPGLGVGLSLSKRLVEKMGGSLSVESRIPGDPRQGTVFVLEAPRVRVS